MAIPETSHSVELPTNAHSDETYMIMHFATKWWNYTRVGTVATPGAPVKWGKVRRRLRLWDDFTCWARELWWEWRP